MTADLITKLIEHEGEVLHAYQDSEGWWTIGIGHLIDKRRNGGISKKISRLIFQEDLKRCTDLLANVDWFQQLDDVRQDVIVMLCFNLGFGGLMGFKKMIAAIKVRNWDEAKFELLNSQWALQVQRERRESLANAMLMGRWE